MEGRQHKNVLLVIESIYGTMKMVAKTGLLTGRGIFAGMNQASFRRSV